MSAQEWLDEADAAITRHLLHPTSVHSLAIRARLRKAVAALRAVLVVVEQLDAAATRPDGDHLWEDTPCGGLVRAILDDLRAAIEGNLR